MNRLLVLAYFIYVLSSCNPLKLNNICDNDCFLFDPNDPINVQKVNSYYRIQIEKELPRVKHAYIYKRPKLTHLTEKQIKNLTEIVDSFNECVLYVYREQSIKDLFKYDYVGSNLRLLQVYKKQFNELLNNYSNDKESKEAIKFFDHKFKKAKNLLEIYDSFKYDTLSKSLLSEKKLRKRLDLDNVTKNQIAIFENLDNYFKQEIVRIDGMRLNRKSQIVFDINSYARLNYSIYIPFRHRKHTNEGCESTNELPLFFNKFPKSN